MTEPAGYSKEVPMVGIADVLARGERNITITLNAEQAEAAVYALRAEAHRQDPDAYPACRPDWPDYDPWPSDISVTADIIEGVARRGKVPAKILRAEAEDRKLNAWHATWLRGEREPGNGT
jgi:hypothetical protein